jgi:hypothetical protein
MSALALWPERYRQMPSRRLSKKSSLKYQFLEQQLDDNLSACQFCRLTHGSTFCDVQAGNVPATVNPFVRKKNLSDCQFQVCAAISA